MILALSACIQEEDLVEIDLQLQPHFEAFREEAMTRDFPIDGSLYEISARLASLPNSAAGQCTSSPGNRLIEVDEDFWTNSDHLQQEFIIFHELGHCYLDRRHDEDENNRGICESIMASGEGSCRYNYTRASRSQYLDELFGSN